jgi:protein-arginine kinase activator protein McsA
MDPCIFPDRKNKVTGTQCKETFTNLKNTGLNTQCYACYKIPDDPISKIYLASLGALGIYITYRIMVKNGMIPNV